MSNIETLAEQAAAAIFHHADQWQNRAYAEKKILPFLTLAHQQGIAEERERCAKVAKTIGINVANSDYVKDELAAAIRKGDGKPLDAAGEVKADA